MVTLQLDEVTPRATAPLILGVSAFAMVHVWRRAVRWKKNTLVSLGMVLAWSIFMYFQVESIPDGIFTEQELKCKDNPTSIYCAEGWQWNRAMLGTAQSLLYLGLVGLVHVGATREDDSVTVKMSRSRKLLCTFLGLFNLGFALLHFYHLFTMVALTMWFAWQVPRGVARKRQQALENTSEETPAGAEVTESDVEKQSSEKETPFIPQYSKVRWFSLAGFAVSYVINPFWQLTSLLPAESLALNCLLVIRASIFAAAVIALIVDDQRIVTEPEQEDLKTGMVGTQSDGKIQL